MASMIMSQASLAARARVAPGSVSLRTRVAPRCVAPVRIAARRNQRLVVRAEDAKTPEVVDVEDDFEQKLAAIRGKKAGGDGKKAAKRIAKKEGRDVALEEAYKPSPTDFEGEVVFFEGPPSTGDLVTNVVLGFTLIWLPLSLASVGRYIWLKYKFTDKRIIMESSSPLDAGVTLITYDQIVKVVTIGRGVGLWGDMVITLKNGDNVEFRSLPGYKELEEKVNKLCETDEKSKDADVKGF